MKVTLTSDESLRVEGDGGTMLTIEAESAERAYSPFHMLASGLALCTHAVLESWAGHANLDAGALQLDVAWNFAEAPHRVARYEMTIRWPGLPEGRRAAASRAATLCAVHATLSHPPAIEVTLEGGGSEKG